MSIAGEVDAASTLPNFLAPIITVESGEIYIVHNSLSAGEKEKILGRGKAKSSRN